MSLRRTHHVKRGYGSPNTVDDNMEWLRDFADTLMTGEPKHVKPDYEKRGGWIDKFGDDLMKEASFEKEAQDQFVLNEPVYVAYAFRNVKDPTQGVDIYLTDKDGTDITGSIGVIEDPTKLNTLANDVSQLAGAEQSQNGKIQYLPTYPRVYIDHKSFENGSVVFDFYDYISGEQKSNIPVGINYLQDYSVRDSNGIYDIKEKATEIGYGTLNINDVIEGWRGNYIENVGSAPPAELFPVMINFLRNYARQIGDPQTISNVFNNIARSGISAKDAVANQLPSEVSAEYVKNQQAQNQQTSLTSMENPKEFIRNLDSRLRDFGNIVSGFKNNRYIASSQDPIIIDIMNNLNPEIDNVYAQIQELTNYFSTLRTASGENNITKEAQIGQGFREIFTPKGREEKRQRQQTEQAEQELQQQRKDIIVPEISKFYNNIDSIINNLGVAATSIDPRTLGIDEAAFQGVKDRVNSLSDSLRNLGQKAFEAYQTLGVQPPEAPAAQAEGASQFKLPASQDIYNQYANVLKEQGRSLQELEDTLNPTLQAIEDTLEKIKTE